nr:MAG TPA: hypothetical protein [Crassvirales sp.]
MRSKGSVYKSNRGEKNHHSERFAALDLPYFQIS